jgi:hypothetical protein
VSGVGARPGETNAYAVTFTVGYAVFHVFGNESGRESKYSIEQPLAGRLRPIWPLLGEPVEWPPRPPLTEADLDALSNAHGEVF